MQNHFGPSNTFKSWLKEEKARLDADSHNQRKKRRSWKLKQPIQVKMGHGGTLDPMATGVLILGVGSGTKSLSGFLECTKSYECVLLFGAATDTYDSEGKVVARKPYEHITREKVEEALDKFRGKIMQQPPIFSALRVQGKRLYEYAREGKEVPVEIKERPIEVEKLEISEWLEGGTHQWRWPDREADSEEKKVVSEVLHLDDGARAEAALGGQTDSTLSRKRKGDDQSNGEVNGANDPEDEPTSKRNKTAPDLDAPGALPNDVTTAETTAAETSASESHTHAVPSTEPEADRPPCPAPAVRLRMTVTSGFYVRSLCHDLGAVLGSLGIMTSLVRSRQGDFELGTNVLWYEDLAQGEEVWGPKVKGMLEEWQGKVKRGEVDLGRGGQGGGGGKKTMPQRDTEPASGARARRNTSSEED